MAQRAFEMDHQRPPNSSDELVPDYLPQRPVSLLTGGDLWSLNQQRKNAIPANPNVLAPVPTVPTEHPAVDYFHWGRMIREAPNDVAVEVNWNTPSRLILFAAQNSAYGE